MTEIVMEKENEKKSKSKRYYWFKLYENFFNSLQIKTIKKKYDIKYVGVYLEIITLAINTNGIIAYENCCDDIEEEISLAIDEDYEVVKETIEILYKTHLIENCDKGIRLLNIDELVGTETDEAIRKRKQRKAWTSSGQITENVGDCPIDNGTYPTEKEKETDTDLNGDRDLERGNPFVRYGKHKMVGLTSKQYDMLLKAMGYDNLHLRIDLVDEDLYDGIAFEESSIVDIIRNYKIPQEMVGKEVQGGVGKLLRELQDDDTPIPF